MKSETLKPLKSVHGEVQVPGDKSISHRSVMFGAIAEGVTRVKGFLAGDDPLATISAFRQMGIQIEEPGAGELVIHGKGLRGLHPPERPIDVGNSGTTIRLLTGLLCGQQFPCMLDGDASIRRRPMKRVIEPLSKMGAKIVDEDGQGHAPLKLYGVAPSEWLKPISYESPVASAQVKSAILLAGLYADGITCVKEPTLSRDHTERMFTTMGVKLDRKGNSVCIRGGQQPMGIEVQVPADISSAAFFIVAALIAGTGGILLKNVGVNPTRDGIIEALKAMGANIELVNRRNFGAEPVADLKVSPSRLRSTEIGGDLIPRMIDEIPVFSVAAAFAGGTTVVRDAAELRVKESDRIATMCEELGKFGIRVEGRDDGMVIHGDPSRRLKGARLSSHGDHRVAMSMAACSVRADADLVIEDVDCVTTSFPGFFELLKGMGH